MELHAAGSGRSSAGDVLQLVFMGVSGCGKSTLARAVAARLGWLFIEGDDLHPVRNMEKMRAGVALDDADRSEWLDELSRQLATHLAARRSVALTCSALKRSYRDTLRSASPGLRFVFLQIDPVQALARVVNRVGHAFPASLVASQFEALETPLGESGVLGVDATAEVALLVDHVVAWVEARGQRAGSAHG